MVVYTNRAQNRKATSAADQLRQILKNGEIIGRDKAGRMIVQLAVEQATPDELMVLSADAAEAGKGSAW